MLKFEKQSMKQLRTMMITSLNSLDLFAQVPVFKILKRQSFTSSLGFMFTLGIVVMCLVQLAIDVNEVMQKTNPAVVMADIQQLSSDPITLSKHNFTFAVTVTNISYSSLKTLNSYFTLKIQNCSRMRRYNETAGKADISQSCFDYEIESCDRDKHFVTNAQKEYFKQFTLSYIYCIKSEQWDARPPVIQGTVVGDDYQFMSVYLQACQNTTESQKCAPQEIIDKQLATGYYAAYMGDTLAQMDGISSSFQDIVSLQFTSFSNQNSKQVYQFIKKQTTLTDIGLISKEQHVDTSLLLSSIRETQDIYNQKFLVLHQFGLDFKATEFKRNYQKLQQILGTVGGLWQVLYLIVAILLKPLVLRLMNLEMANKLFSFDVSDKRDSFQPPVNLQHPGPVLLPDEVMSFRSCPDSSRNRNSSVIKNKLAGKQSKYSVFKPKPQVDIITKERISNFIKFKKRNLILGYKQLLLLFCGCKSKEKQQLDYATQKIMNKLDVSFIITKLFEIDRLKTVLLTNDQQKIFNYLPRPAIPDLLFDKESDEKIKQLESIPQYQYILEEEQSEFMRLTAAHAAYQSINKSSVLSQTEKKLISLLDHETVQLFNNIDNTPVSDPQEIFCEQQQQQMKDQSQLEESIYKIPVMIIQPPRNHQSSI